MTEIKTLGDLINRLEKCNQNATVTIQPFRLYPTDFESYRGDYSELALGYKADYNAEPIYVKDILNMAKECLGKTFIGYKGGEFLMSESTPLWISNYGDCSDVKICDIKQPFRDSVEIHCFKYDE